jgi:hypothetical protein
VLSAAAPNISPGEKRGSKHRRATSLTETSKSPLRHLSALPTAGSSKKRGSSSDSRK